MPQALTSSSLRHNNIEFKSQVIHILSEIVKQKNWKNYEEWIMDTRENQNSELGLGL